MPQSVTSRALFVLLAMAVALPALADNVTVSGTVSFSSLDGSSLDHDGVANGVFTVNDGNLTIQGTVNCNDSPSSSACSMTFVVSGNFVMTAGSGLFAEDRTGPGNGGDIAIQAGGDVTLQSPSGVLAGAKISTGRSTGGSAGQHAGAIAITSGGATNLQAGSIVSASAADGAAGAISVTGGGLVTVGGLVAAGPSSTVSAATKYTGDVLTGGLSTMQGGPITIKSTSHVQPALIITGDGIIVSQGGSGGSGSVTLEGCDVRVLGLVASNSGDGSGARVVVRSGTSITVDGRDVGLGAPTLGRFGVIRADSTFSGTTGAMRADLFAANDISIFGPDAAFSSVFAVNANGGNLVHDISGAIRVTSTAGAVSASGNALSASGSNAGDQGGSIAVSSKNNVTLDGATLKAKGDHNPPDPFRKGGSINVRSYSGGVSWQAGVGDARPVGSTAGIPAADQGTIVITYCTTVSTVGSSFPTNGAPVGTYPALASSCSPAAPSLPASEPPLPNCNQPPVANNDSYTVAEGGTLNVAAPGVLGNDVDPDGDPITAVLVSGPAHASSFTLNANGSFTYVHDGGETTSDSFTYRASDGASTSNVATVSITVTPVNDAPVANNDSATVAEGGTINFAPPGVLANDTDPDSPTLTAVLVTGPAHASSFTLNADGSYVYVHDSSETTSDSFTYKASDGSLTSNTATVSITVTPVNDAPVANNDSYSVDEGGTLNVASPGVLGNDTDPDSPTLTAILVSGPAHASSFTLNANGSFTYVHDGSETTSDSFTYRANDGSANSNVATVSITVNPVNDAPVAVNDGPYTVAEGGSLTVPAPGVLGNDTDPDSPTLTAILVTGPAHASSFTLNPDGSFTYVHDGSETIADSFTYRASDGSATSNIATVTIAITPVNDPPVANNDTYGVDEGGTLNVAAPGVLGNDTDPDSPTLTAVLVTGPAHATSFTLNADGSFSYVHDGSETTSDSFTYRANDGSANSNIATVTINVTPVNDPPVANNDSYTVNEGGTLNIAAPGVLGNDTDPDSPTLTTVLVTGPAHATSFTLNPNGSFSYVHDGSETVVDSFTYRASDGSATSNIATVTINITPVNDPPVANNDTYGVNEGGTLNVAAPGVLGNDTDPDSPTLTAVLVTGPAHATSFTLNADGSFHYVHDGGETLVDSFTYRANDGSANSNIATVTINITPVNDPPVANNDAYSTNSNTPLNVAAPGVLGNDTDPDSPTLTAVLVSGPAHAASFALNANGSFSYTPTAGFAGTDSFTYKANDGAADSNVATATITVIAQPPTAVNDSYNAVGNTQLRVGTGAAMTPSAQIPGASVLDNDTDPDTPHGSLTVSAFDGTSSAGGNVSMNPNGSFNYLPPVGFTGTDTFHYTVTDGTSSSTGLVSIFVSDRVWYVKNDAGPGDGRSVSPFNNLFAAEFASAIGDIIYVHTGNGTTSGQNAGIVLKANQKLIGQGVALVVGVYTLNPASLAPVIGNAGGIGVTLANANTVAGLKVTSSAGGISGTSSASGNFTSVDVAAGTDGILLINTTGTWNVTDVTINTGGGTAFNINNGSPTINAFNLNATSTSFGDKGILGAGTGTLNISGASNVTATNGIAFDVGDMTLGVTLVSVNASNSSSGIRLVNTTGSFTVTGTGTTAGSGGTIQNMTARGAVFFNATNLTLKNMNFVNASTTQTVSGTLCGGNLVSGDNLQCNAAIYLSNVTNAAFDRILVDGSVQVGINGNGVSGFSLTNSEVRNAGNESFESGLLFQNLSGTCAITNSNIHNNAARQFYAESLSGALTLSVSGSTFSNSVSPNGQQGLLLVLDNGASATVDVQSSTFASNGSGNANGLQMNGNNSATLDVTIAGSTFQSNAAGINLVVGSAASLTYAIHDNPVFTGNALQAINVAKLSPSTGTVSGTITNNTIGTALVVGSACNLSIACNGIDLRPTGGGSYAVTVSGNTIHGVGNFGINVSATNGNGTLNAKVSSNTIGTPGPFSANAIFSQSGATSTDTTSVCADIINNVISGVWDALGSASQIRVRNRFAGTTFRLPGFPGPGNSTAAVAAFLSGQNGGASASATINGNTFGGGAACATP
ncbi:MAG TPA: Ig-like domain-containing protein [Thermoanaerobaculia bacterium]